MSPYPAQVTRDAIVDRARDIIETEGLERLTLQHLATALGIQAPSLYRHVGSKNELLRAVNEITTERLVSTVLAAADGQASPVARIVNMANAYRDFAHAFPATYSLAFSAGPTDIRPDAAERGVMVQPVQSLLNEVCGEANALTAFRSLFALLHGFVTLEQSNQFNRGGDLDRAFLQSVETLVNGWVAANPES
jgi:AcrR family transcriptional regulator